MAKQKYEQIYVGDTLGLLEYQLLENGEPAAVDLATDVVCRWVNRDDPSVVVVDDKDGVVVDGPNGVIGFQRTTADVAVAATVIVQFTSTDPGGAVHKSPEIELPILPAI